MIFTHFSVISTYQHNFYYFSLWL